MNNKLNSLIGLLVFCTVSFSYGQDAPTRDKIIEEQAYTLGTSAYLWGYTMNELYRNRDNFLKQEGNELNKFNHFQTLLTPSLAKEMGVVSANIATLYSQAWLDISIEPIILDFPEIQDRYFTFNYVDYYQVNGNLSSETVSRKGGSYAFVGPGWKGILPENVHRVEVNTNTIWIMGRTEVKGDDDFDAVIELQKEYSLTSLSEWINGNRNTTDDNKYYQWPEYDLTEP